MTIPVGGVTMSGGGAHDVLIGRDGDNFLFDVADSSANDETIGVFVPDQDRIGRDRSVLTIFASNSVMNASDPIPGVMALTDNQPLVSDKVQGALHYKPDGFDFIAKMQIPTPCDHGAFNGADFYLTGDYFLTA